MTLSEWIIVYKLVFSSLNFWEIFSDSGCTHTHWLDTLRAVCLCVRVERLAVCLSVCQWISVVYILWKQGVASSCLTVLFCLCVCACVYVCQPYFGIWKRVSELGCSCWRCVIISKSAHSLTHTNAHQMLFLATGWCKDDSDVWKRSVCSSF